MSENKSVLIPDADTLQMVRKLIDCKCGYLKSLCNTAIQQRDVKRYQENLNAHNELVQLRVNLDAEYLRDNLATLEGYPAAETMYLVPIP